MQTIHFGGSMTWYDKSGKIVLSGGEVAKQKLLDAIMPFTEKREDVPEHGTKLPIPTQNGAFMGTGGLGEVPKWA